MSGQGVGDPDAGQNWRARLSGYVLSVVSGRRGMIPGIIRAALSCLAVLYASGLKSYLFLYRIGIRRATRLPCRVVCVGNLTTGGTGKTPTTQMLCRMLTDAGLRVAVIIRGYGGEYEHRCALVSDGERTLLTAREAGDEAALLARTLPGVPIAVGRDRIRSGQLLNREFRPDIIVMDDGMQHWRVHRDLDIALLNACKPFDNGWTVPRGMLREPKEHLRRAGVILLTNARRAGEEQLERVRAEVANLAPGTPVFDGDLAPAGLLDLSGRECKDAAWLDGKRVTAVSALGNPASFEAMLEEQGATIAEKFRFPDHHGVTDQEFAEIFRASVRADADAVVTTEKDAVKMPAVPGPLPVYVLRVSMAVNREPAFVSAVMSRVRPPHEDMAGATLSMIRIRNS